MQIKGEEIRAQHANHSHVYLVDPRLGFNHRTFRFWINRIPAGEEEGMGWKTLGHRHTVEAVIYVLQGRGHSIIDGVRHDWAPGDFISVPMFSWHRHLNTGNEDFIYLAATTGPLSLALGLAVYEDERYPDYWVFGNKSESAMKSMIPGADDSTRVSMQAESTTEPLNPTDAIYREQLVFSGSEEKKGARAGCQWRAPVSSSENTDGPSALYHRSKDRISHACAGHAARRISPGKRSGAHRHMYEEVNYIIAGQGYSLIEDRRYDWSEGEVLCIPVFSWHYILTPQIARRASWSITTGR